MASPYVNPVEVDEVRVTIIVDNSIDVLLPSSEVAERFLMGPKWLQVMAGRENPFGLSRPSLSMVFRR